MNVIQVPLEHEFFEKEMGGEFHGFIYDECSFIFTLKGEIKLGVTVFIENNKAEINGTQIYLVRHNEEWIDGIFYQIAIKEDSEIGFEVLCNSLDERYTKIGFSIVNTVLKTMFYIMNVPRDRTLRNSCPKGKIHKNNNSKMKNYSRENSIYLLDEIVEYVRNNDFEKNNSRNNEIKCSCWSVRGHYRHYKSGKIIFIKNYLKGKDRENAEPKNKIYKI